MTCRPKRSITIILALNRYRRTLHQASRTQAEAAPAATTTAWHGRHKLVVACSLPPSSAAVLWVSKRSIFINCHWTQACVCSGGQPAALLLIQLLVREQAAGQSPSPLQWTLRVRYGGTEQDAGTGGQRTRVLKAHGQRLWGGPTLTPHHDSRSL